jgi:cell division septal protein FtsQ
MMFKKKKHTKRRKKNQFQTVSVSSFLPQTLTKGQRRRKPTRKNTRTSATVTALPLPHLNARAWQFSHYVALLLMIGSVVLLSLVFTDSTFALTQMVVTDNNYLGREQILQQAHVSGVNIFRIDPQQVNTRLETMLPQIKEAHVRLGIPNQIAIQVVEREPVLLYGHGAQSYWVDTEGHLFPATTQRADLPVLVDEDGTARHDSSVLNPVIWQTIQQVAAIMPETTEFHYRHVYGLFFISPEGWRVYLGEAENMEAKLSLWQTLHRQLLQENRSVQIVDLRYDRVYIQ